LKSCGTACLLTALTAAIVGRHWNEINKHHLDIRMPATHRVLSADPAKDMKDWLERHRTEAGPDLLNLSNSPEFLNALRTEDFYKYAFDEAFQVSQKAVIFGYRSAHDPINKRPVFVLVRFPAGLADALFDCGNKNCSISR
jgi:hypothetical protein